MAEAQLIPITGTCNVCNKTRLDIGEHVIGDASEGELWDLLGSHAPRRGWMVMKREDGQRQLVCPACVAELPIKESGPLTPFGHFERCPKCRSDQLRTKHCFGVSPECWFGIQRDHLHLLCVDCGYNWITETADKKKPWWKFWR